VRIDRDESVVGCAASQSTSTRVQSAHHLRTGWRVETSVETAIRSLIAGLEVTGLTLLIGVVLDEEVPGKVGIL
jgi:hypothetical protein